MKIIKAIESWPRVECCMDTKGLDLWQDDDFICLHRKQARDLYNFLKVKFGKNKSRKQKKIK